MDFKSTIVSAFVTDINKISRSVSEYIENGISLLKLNIPKVIYIEKHIYDEYLSNKEYPNTHFIFIEKHDIYLYKYHYKITKFEMNTLSPGKDTIEYMFVQCNKTEWIKQSIELNHFNTEQFIWVDFGIKHMIKEGEEEFKKYIENFKEKQYNSIRISSCLDLTLKYQELNIYNRVVWFFAGSVFGGNKDKLLQFASLMKEKCIQIINEKHSIMWEINIWYLIYKEHPELFDSYLCNHNISIIKNY